MLQMQRKGRAEPGNVLIIHNITHSLHGRCSVWWTRPKAVCCFLLVSFCYETNISWKGNCCVVFALRMNFPNVSVAFLSFKWETVEWIKVHLWNSSPWHIWSHLECIWCLIRCYMEHNFWPVRMRTPENARLLRTKLQLYWTLKWKILPLQVWGILIFISKSFVNI